MKFTRNIFLTICFFAITASVKLSNKKPKANNSDNPDLSGIKSDGTPEQPRLTQPVQVIDPPPKANIPQYTAGAANFGKTCNEVNFVSNTLSAKCTPIYGSNKSTTFDLNDCYTVGNNGAIAVRTSTQPKLDKVCKNCTFNKGNQFMTCTCTSSDQKTQRTSSINLNTNIENMDGSLRCNRIY